MAQKALENERARIPLFASQLVTETVEARLQRQDDDATLACQGLRDSLARAWRQARRRLARLPPAERRAILREWNHHRWLPGKPEYLLDLLHRCLQGYAATHEETLHARLEGQASVSLRKAREQHA